MRRYRYIFLTVFGVFALVFVLQTPLMHPQVPLFVVKEGTPFSSIARELYVDGVITSPQLLRIAVTLRGGTKRVKAGPYRFDRRERLLDVATRLVQGDYGIEPTRIGFPEGLPAHNMATLLVPIIGEEEAERFANRADAYEGYLFPDTYFILPSDTAMDLIELFTDTFVERTADLKLQAQAQGRSWSDVVIMASIVEEEARTIEDKRRVAGILWKRLDDDMLLQVDAPFAYLLGKASHELTLDDLDLDSPFNTYQYRGLPPSPISNPGLDTIEATLSPTESPYWFYLSDSDGLIHYARTYDEHLQNKARYIE